ncbi:uncharacterized protein LOC122659380 [Telopea speciosissima]|uniref:uncharacterized protein LOC122659380 n=1 Tax=Telopea speciosissima TaxID=54955 RepID=UPI001CC41939|nr:uncharacterized protein LOC122659380 [Telopea speciosissima]
MPYTGYEKEADKNELFNLRHSSLRNCIECTFMLLKKRFKILKNQPEYPFKMQIKIVNVCILLHNHILTQNNIDKEEAFFEAEEEEASTSNSTATAVETDVEYENDDNDVEDVSNIDWDQFREGIADNMWDSWMAGDVDDDDMSDDLNDFDDVNDSN